MYIVIDDISKGIDLQKPINNRNNSKRIGLVRARLVYTFYNIEEDEKMYLKNDTHIIVKKGFYSINNILRHISSRINYSTLNGKSIIGGGIKNFDYYLHNILGVNNDNYVDLLLSKKSFTFSTDTLSTTDNLHNGIPSNTLHTGYTPKDVSFGDTIIFERTNVQYKTMRNGIIDHIKVELLDNDRNIINSNLPTSVVLHIV